MKTLEFDKVAHKKRMEWFNHARFGMFIHWGAYAVPAKGEWYKTQARLTNEEYQKYIDQFDPTHYDPKKWAALAKGAGMKYAIMTAKHHDGFCMFDSKLTDYKYAKRDLIKEYVQAFRDEGIKVWLYYSVIDWHHPEYPHFGDEKHPQRENKDFEGKAHDFDVYLDYMHGQVKELCTNYGQIDILWFDFSYDNMVGEKWRASDLMKMVRELQPNVIVDNRLEDHFDCSLKSGSPKFYAGDFLSPEQIMPPEGLLDANGKRLPWEACITMNDNWGYVAADKNFKSHSTLIKKLIECVSKGGNLLLNVGPDARGRIPNESVNILENIGRWMDKNGESIYGCGYGEIGKPELGRYTRNGNKIYFHIMENSVGPMPLVGIPKDKIEKIRMLADGSEVKNGNEDWRTKHFEDVTFLLVPNSPELPDPISTVVEVTLKD